MSDTVLLEPVELEIGAIPQIELEIRDDAPLGLTIGGEIYGMSTPPYEGAYEADALFSEQVFPTRDKRMTDDFTVHAINYTEAPNDYGITVTIGG